MKPNSVLAKTALLAVMAWSPLYIECFKPLAVHAETMPAQITSPRVIAQANPYDPYPDFDSGFYPLLRSTMEMIESAKAAMKSNDPEVKAMGQKMYESGMKDLQGMMMMWMKRYPIRSTSPRP
jgi:hypothetical protein